MRNASQSSTNAEIVFRRYHEILKIVNVIINSLIKLYAILLIIGYVSNIQYDGCLLMVFLWNLKIYLICH